MTAAIRSSQDFRRRGSHGQMMWKTDVSGTISIHFSIYQIRKDKSYCGLRAYAESLDLVEV